MNLQVHDCVLEIGGQAFDVTRIIRETVCFHPGAGSVTRGRTTGRLNFGGGVWFAVSGTVRVAGPDRATLSDVRVLPTGDQQVAPLGMGRQRTGPEGPFPVLRCA